MSYVCQYFQFPAFFASSEWAWRSGYFGLQPLHKKQNGNWYKLCSVVLLRDTIRDAEEKSGLQMSQISLTSLERCERYPPQSSHLDNA